MVTHLSKKKKKKKKRAVHTNRNHTPGEKKQLLSLMTPIHLF
jgi:hypothetical protein